MRCRPQRMLLKVLMNEVVGNFDKRYGHVIAITELLDKQPGELPRRRAAARAQAWRALAWLCHVAQHAHASVHARRRRVQAACEVVCVGGPLLDCQHSPTLRAPGRRFLAGC